MARAILALPTIFECHNGLSHSGTQVCNWPCHNGSNHSYSQVMQLAVSEWLEPFWHSSYATGRVRMARAILALKSCNLHGCARMARAILALKFGQWHYLRAKMARAILALPTIFECHNGLSHSGTQVMQQAVPEWLNPFLHSSHATGRVRMARAILALKLCNWPCQNGSNHSYTQVMQLAVSEWLKPFWHSNYATGHARMARTILTLKSCNWPCQNGLIHSYTQVM